jgi:plasmid stability protein
MLCEQSSAYDPEELSLLGDIFDRTVASLPGTMRTPFNRGEIARNILTRAAAGEREPIELELAALDNLKVAINSTHQPSGEQVRARLRELQILNENVVAQQQSRWRLIADAAGEARRSAAKATSATEAWASSSKR